MSPLLNTAIQAARAAGKVIQQSMSRPDRIDIKKKANNSYVTSVDLQAETKILDLLQEAYPNHNILSEEASNIINDESNEHLWIIDPLDGTTNFIRSLPYFCVSIALKIGNKLQVAVIYDPVNDDLFTAERNKGSTLNDRRIYVSKANELNGSVVAAAHPNPNRFSSDYLPFYSDLTQRVSGIRRTGACALDMAHVAAGRLDAMWQPKLKIWDVAAGALLVREAKGTVCDLQGGMDHLEEKGVVCGHNKIVQDTIRSIHQWVI